MFIYFDLGNVVLKFSNERLCSQVSELTGTSIAEVRKILFEERLKERAEAGGCTRAEFYETLRRGLATEVPAADLENAVNDIFAVNLPIIPILAALQSAGFELGILSNICESHWQHVNGGRYPLVSQFFSRHVLSYQVGAIKPDPAIFLAAAKIAGVPPSDVFYIDDIGGHVEAARRVGYQGVQFIDTDRLIRDLRTHDIRCNI